MNNQLPFSAQPINWLEAVECRFGQLREVLDRANAAGFQPIRMAVIPLGYKLQFQRKPTNATQGELNRQLL
jgi:hypothetical protein